uniref:Indolethylamine N-methyltransferase n=1 Tax=Salvator merianae TaxID=96440 RepID=A0A8D0E893_SALMN
TMAEFTGGDVYQAKFDPKAYLEYFTLVAKGSMEEEYLALVLEHFCKTFTSGQVRGKILIDIGSGPTIYQLLSACEAFGDITVSDYLDQNIQEIEKWLKNEPGAFNWTPVVKYVCELEGNRYEKEAKLRKTIKQLLKCDVHQGNPVDPVTLSLADCVISSECLESACRDHESYRAALRNMSSLLKHGGHLVLAGVLQTTFYMVGPHRFSSLFLTEEFLREAISSTGFAILEFNIRNTGNGPISRPLSGIRQTRPVYLP